MEKWLYYSIILILVYIVWTIVFEYIAKKHTNCFCVTLFTYIFAGIICILLLHNHIYSGKCKHFGNFGDIKDMSKQVAFFILILSVCIIISNRMWMNGLSSGGNSGYIGSVSNLYIIFVTFISAYMFKNKINKENIFGILLMTGGAFLIAKK
jgi:uncharacterized membrane protein